MSIIVATALGPYDHDAREVAGLLAKRMSERLALVHVIERHEPPEPVIRGMLDRAAHEAGRFGAVVDGVILRGDPSTALTDYARRVAPRFVIIGGAAPADARGNSERRKARHLLGILKVPVLVVPHAGPMMQALMSGHHLRLLVRSERDARANAALIREARALRAIAPCEVSVLCASRETAARSDPAIRTGEKGPFDLVVLDASALSSSTAWATGPGSKPMLFVPSPSRPSTPAARPRPDANQ